MAVTESQTPDNEVEKLLLPSEDSKKEKTDRTERRMDGQKEKETLKELLNTVTYAYSPSRATVPIRIPTSFRRCRKAQG